MKFLKTIFQKGAFCTFLSLVSVSLIASIPAYAQTAHKYSGNLMAYPYLEQTPPKQTPAPEEYLPFHLEHYGRHGSRWLIGSEDYSVPVANLEKAQKAGLLTPLGDSVLNALRNIQQASLKRGGELTDVGALQHLAIGRRMAENFPEIFIPEAEIDAKSTVVIRCILSMSNALQGIESVAPGVNPTKDASYADMWFMNYDDRPAWVVKDSAEAIYLKPYREKMLRKLEGKEGDFYLDRLVSDRQFARDSVAPGMLPRFYWVLANVGSHSNQPWLLEEVFSPEELEANWRLNNASWFIHGGNSAMTEGRLPYTQRMLLGRMIERTDSAIASGKPGANLRFGHDGILLNLVTLMEIGNYGNRIDSLEALETEDWHDYDIIPMGGNLQIVFYKSSDDKSVLVKALLNEREISLPGEPVVGPYYDWGVLRNYYINKLESSGLPFRPAI